MGDSDDKIRLAITVFCDAERLHGALNAVFALGLEESIWLAGKGDVMTAQSGLPRRLAQRDPDLEALFAQIVELRALPGKGMLCGTGGAAFQFLKNARGQADKSCLDALLDGNLVAKLMEREPEGIIAAVHTSAPDLQDKCMRILLRHSQHIVYSRECRRESATGLRDLRI